MITILIETEDISSLYPIIDAHLESNNEVSSELSLLYSLAIDNTEIADKQYFKQRRHELKLDDTFNSYSANFPCFWGEAFVDSPNNSLSGDGGKWLCGVKYLQKPCIVYSLGNDNNWRFELGLNELTDNKCEIYTFDPYLNDTQHVPTKEFLATLPTNIHFYRWGVGDIDEANDEKTIYRLNIIMSLLNHKFIDILKIDIESWEFPLFYNLHTNNMWPSIGQIVIEIHPKFRFHLHMKLWERSFGKIISGSNTAKSQLGALIELLEKYSFRIFHKEPNMYWLTELCEYSLIQKYWRPNIKNYSRSPF